MVTLTGLGRSGAGSCGCQREAAVVALLSGSVDSPVPSPVVAQSRMKVMARDNKIA